MEGAPPAGIGGPASHEEEAAPRRGPGRMSAAVEACVDHAQLRINLYRSAECLVRAPQALSALAWLGKELKSAPDVLRAFAEFDKLARRTLLYNLDAIFVLAVKIPALERPGTAQKQEPLLIVRYAETQSLHGCLASTPYASQLAAAFEVPNERVCWFSMLSPDELSTLFSRTDSGSHKRGRAAERAWRSTEGDNGASQATSFQHLQKVSASLNNQCSVEGLVCVYEKHTATLYNTTTHFFGCDANPRHNIIQFEASVVEWAQHHLLSPRVARPMPTPSATTVTTVTTVALTASPSLATPGAHSAPSASSALSVPSAASAPATADATPAAATLFVPASPPAVPIDAAQTFIGHVQRALDVPSAVHSLLREPAVAEGASQRVGNNDSLATAPLIASTPWELQEQFIRIGVVNTAQPRSGSPLESQAWCYVASTTRALHKDGGREWLASRQALVAFAALRLPLDEYISVMKRLYRTADGSVQYSAPVRPVTTSTAAETASNHDPLDCPSLTQMEFDSYDHQDDDTNQLDYDENHQLGGTQRASGDQSSGVHAGTKHHTHADDGEV